MNAPTVELLLRQAVVLLQDADAMNAAGDYRTFTLQRQARETLAAALDVVDEVRHVNPELHELQDRRAAALATMRASARDLKAFAEAAKVEADLAFQIRRLKRAAVGVQAVRS